MRPPFSPARARRQTARGRPRGAVVAPCRTAVSRAALVAAALASPTFVARAQGGDADSTAALVRVDRAFEPAVTFWVGAVNFGSRSSSPQATFGYSSGVAIGLTGEYPLTRRSAFMADVSIVPGAKQEVSGSGSAGSFNANTAVVATADAGLAARLKVNVPVFFFAGVGALRASRFAYPTGTSGGTTEPRATVAVGYDAGLHSRGRIGLRAMVAAHFSKPADSGAADQTTKSLTTDYSFRLGARVRLSSRGGR